MKKHFWYLLCIIYSCAASAQERYPSNYFIAPLKLEQRIAGNFGELRPNHFHAGLDFKTNGTEGHKIYAIADGYVSRIKISPYGYGNALYITHSNGYVSVYGHLSHFNTAIDSFVDICRKHTKTFEVHEMPLPNQFRVQQGQVIGYSGNSGRSSGPHLHFEVREELTEAAINPFYFGYDVPDNIAPVISNFYIYSHGQMVNRSFKPTGAVGKYKYNIPISISEPSFVGLSVYDNTNGSGNKNGIFEINIRQNDTLIFNLKNDEIKFAQNHCVNDLIDLKAKKTGLGYIYRCFKNPNNPLETVFALNQALIQLSPGEKAQIQVEVADFFGNKALLNFTLIGGANANTVLPERNISLEQNYLLRYQGLEVYIPSNALYKPSNIDIKLIGKSVYSGIYSIGSPYEPLLNPILLRFKMSDYNRKTSNIMLIFTDTDGKKTYYQPLRDTSYIYAWVSKLGIYQLGVDAVKPSVVALSGATITAGKNFYFSLKDAQSDIASYQAFIDQQWIVPVYDAKVNKVSVKVPNSTLKGMHELYFYAIDYGGNKTELKVNIRVN